MSDFLDNKCIIGETGTGSGSLLEAKDETEEKEDELIKFMSGFEGYLDQLEKDAVEQRRAKKLREMQSIHTVSSDDEANKSANEEEDESDDDDDWEDCIEDSDESELDLETICRYYRVNHCDSDSSDCFGFDGRSYYKSNGYRIYSDGDFDYDDYGIDF